MTGRGRAKNLVRDPRHSGVLKAPSNPELPPRAIQMQTRTISMGAPGEESFSSPQLPLQDPLCFTFQTHLAVEKPARKTYGQRGLEVRIQAEAGPQLEYSPSVNKKSEEISIADQTLRRTSQIWALFSIRTG